MSVKHAGCIPILQNTSWSGSYQLKPYPIWDAAPMWKRGMFNGGIQVISFQIKKPIPIGKGGMILTDDLETSKWLRKARHDSREITTFYAYDDFEFYGWHYYMTPEDAARGILLMDAVGDQDFPLRSSESYIDLSTKTLFKNESL